MSQIEIIIRVLKAFPKGLKINQSHYNMVVELVDSVLEANKQEPGEITLATVPEGEVK